MPILSARCVPHRAPSATSRPALPYVASLPSLLREQRAQSLPRGDEVSTTPVPAGTPRTSAICRWLSPSSANRERTTRCSAESCSERSPAFTPVGSARDLRGRVRRRGLRWRRRALACAGASLSSRGPRARRFGRPRWRGAPLHEPAIHCSLMEGVFGVGFAPRHVQAKRKDRRAKRREEIGERLLPLTSGGGSGLLAEEKLRFFGQGGHRGACLPVRVGFRGTESSLLGRGLSRT